MVYIFINGCFNIDSSMAQSFNSSETDKPSDSNNAETLSIAVSIVILSRSMMFDYILFFVLFQYVVIGNKSHRYIKLILIFCR